MSQPTELPRVGLWQWCPDTGTMLWSDSLFRLYGFEPGSVEPSPQWLLSRVHPEDVERVNRQTVAAVRNERLESVEYRFAVAGGGWRAFRSAFALVWHDRTGARWFAGAVQDAAAGSEASARARLYRAFGRTLAEWKSLPSSGRGLINALASALGCELGVIWLPLGGSIQPSIVWSDEALAGELGRRIGRLALGPGVGLAGRVWQSGSAMLVSDLASTGFYELPEAVATYGLRCAAAVPVLHDGNVLAVLSLASREPAAVGGDTLTALAEIGSELGTFLQRRAPHPRDFLLTPRELEVLSLAADGASVSMTAVSLGISPSTVKHHLEQIYRRLGVSDRAAAVATGLRAGLIE